MRNAGAYELKEESEREWCIRHKADSYGPQNSLPLAALRLAREPRTRSASDVERFTASALVMLSRAASEPCSSIADARIERVPNVAGRVERRAELRDDFVLDLPRALSRVRGQQRCSRCHAD